MKKPNPQENLYRIAKALLISIAMFFVLLLVFNILLKFTGLPEKWMVYYVMASLCLSTFASGLLGGGVVQKKGIFCGAAFAVITLLCILMIAYATGEQSGLLNFLQIRYLLCLLFGSIGGMIGVNLKI